VSRFDRDFRRRLLSSAVGVAALACVVIALIPLGDILYTAFVNGARAIRPGFFTENGPLPCNGGPAQGCSYGGIFPALEGTLILVALAALIAIPVGILAGIYLAEFGRNRFGDVARLCADVLAGVPSIVFAVVVFSMLYGLEQAGYLQADWVFSIFAAGLALALVMLPIVARTAEEALRSVPTSLRESALALGLPRYRVVLRIVLSTGRAGLITGALLATARAAGETAPLIILDAGNPFPLNSADGLHQTSASLTIVIYDWIQSPYSNWVTDAWGTALILVLIMLGISLLARIALRNRFGGRRT
jgi:phosphate transport system permease protein